MTQGYFAVFDGHCESEAVQFVRDRLHTMVGEQSCSWKVRDSDHNLLEALSVFYIETVSGKGWLNSSSRLFYLSLNIFFFFQNAYFYGGLETLFCCFSIKNDRNRRARFEKHFYLQVRRFWGLVGEKDWYSGMMVLNALMRGRCVPTASFAIAWLCWMFCAFLCLTRAIFNVAAH